MEVAIEIVVIETVRELAAARAGCSAASVASPTAASSVALSALGSDLVGWRSARSASGASGI
jgi:hypothetical protein